MASRAAASIKPNSASSKSLSLRTYCLRAELTIKTGIDKDINDTKESQPNTCSKRSAARRMQQHEAACSPTYYAIHCMMSATDVGFGIPAAVRFLGKSSKRYLYVGMSAIRMRQNEAACSRTHYGTPCTMPHMSTYRQCFLDLPEEPPRRRDTKPNVEHHEMKHANTWHRLVTGVRVPPIIIATTAIDTTTATTTTTTTTTTTR